MKKTISITLGILLLFGVSFFSLFNTHIEASNKPDNTAGARKFEWNLSGDVMPVPPHGLYGTADIIGSDTASKLMVNWPNGNVGTNVTGIMKGLNANTTYTVYLAKPYVPYTPTDVRGEWTWTVLNTYHHDIYINEQNSDGTFSGIGGYPVGTFPYENSGQTSEVITNGFVSGNYIRFTTTYEGPYNEGYTATVVGTIQTDGSITGVPPSPWAWSAPEGAVTLAEGSKGFSGLLPGISAFTFMTDDKGEGSWHYNFMEVIDAFSVWINGGGKTILISDPIVR